MKVQCNCCKKVLVDGTWTSDPAVEKTPGMYTVCRSCLDSETYARYEPSSPALNKLALTSVR